VSWLRLDDGFAEHPKVLELSDAALRLHIRAMCWVARQETDGAIPPAALRSLSAKAKLAEELVASGLWEKADAGHVIHDYLAYNPSKAENDAGREAARRRAGLRADPQLMGRLKQRDLNLCRYCGREVNWGDRRGPVGGTYDHVIPISKGGSDDFHNLVVACRECNSGKCDRTPEQWGHSLLPIGTKFPTGKTPVTPSRPVPSPDLIQPETTTQRPDSSERESGGGQVVEIAESQRETSVPLTLVELLKSLGVVTELAKKHDASEEDIVFAVDEFVGYWCFSGPGKGAKKSNWPYHARRRIAERARDGRLIGQAKPPGLTAHAVRKGISPDSPALERPEHTVFRPKPVDVAPVGTAGEASAKFMASLRNHT
jgi:hypothetical protein